MSVTLELVCPICASKIEYKENCLFLQCFACKSKFKKHQNVLLLSEPNSSWNLIPVDLIQKINFVANEKSWKEAINILCPPRFFPIVYEDGRVDWKYLLNVNSNSSVLDFGSGLGAISTSLAREGARVVALDKTPESLEFIKIRTSQECLSNVIPICYQGATLPFPDSYFDTVILNGVLEWIVSDQAYCTYEDSFRKKDFNKKYTPIKLNRQKELLKECYRILKDNGCVYIGIENRIAIKYFLTVPEDHMDLMFISLLPRRLADKLCMMRTGTPYLAKTYTKEGYRSLLNDAGFQNCYFYMPIPDYRRFDKLVACDDKLVRDYFLNDYRGMSKWYFIYKFLHRFNILDLFANSYSIFAFKDYSSLGKTFSPIMDKLGIKEDNVRFYIGGRSSYRGNVSVELFPGETNKTPIYIKMNRDPRDGANIEKEYNALAKAGRLCQGGLKGRIIKTDIFVLENGRKALVQEACMGKNLAQYFNSLNYNKQLCLAAEWLPALTEWLSNFHLKSTKLCKVNDPKIRQIALERLSMAKKVDESVGSNLYDSVSRIINNLQNTDFSLPVGFIHGDFSPVNILVKQNESYYVIDWEDAHPEDCGLDDICNLFFSFGVRLREKNFENRFISIHLLFKFIRTMLKRLNKKNRHKYRKQQNVEDYTFYSDSKLLAIMRHSWENYSEKIGLNRESINLWFPLCFVKYAAMEILPRRNSIDKCRNWVNLFNKVQKDKFKFY